MELERLERLFPAEKDDRRETAPRTHPPGIAKGFQKEYDEATKWKEELSKHKEISEEVSIQHLALKDFLDAVEAAYLHMREL